MSARSGQLQGANKRGGRRREKRVCLSVTLCGGGYIYSTARGKPLSKEGKCKIEREVNDFHSERMNSPPQTSSLEYWAQASLRYPIVAQAAQKYLCIPASSAPSKRSFSKARHIVRARQARLSEKHVKELFFCLGTRT